MLATRTQADGMQSAFAQIAGGRWMMRAAFVVLCFLPLGGCGLVAAPCRVGSAALKIVPLAGQVAAAPTDACADTIDPTPTKS
jgi:hypothetical protein